MKHKHTKIGVVGLGAMGSGMARRLFEEGYEISAVYDIRPEITQELARELKSHQAVKRSEVTERSEVILTVVPDDQAMRDIFTRPDDNLLMGAHGRIFINFSTVSPDIHLEIEAGAARVGAHSIEACMVSSINQARHGTLYLILAGNTHSVEMVMPVLESLSIGHRYVGYTGRAAQVKVLANMVRNINTAGLAEGLGLGEALGMDLDMLREVFSQTGANSRVLATDGADMQNRQHECYLPASHAANDFGIAVALAEESRIDVPLTRAALAQYRLMVEKGLGNLDKSGVAELTFKGRNQ